MSVVKSKRKQSQFEVFHHLMKMRQRITDLLLRDFGYSFEKFNKKLEKRYGRKPYEELTDTQKHDYERQKKRNESFDEWFIAHERETIMDCLHAVNEHVYVANSIYPTAATSCSRKERIWQSEQDRNRSYFIGSIYCKIRKGSEVYEENELCSTNY